MQNTFFILLALNQCSYFVELELNNVFITRVKFYYFKILSANHNYYIVNLIILFFVFHEFLKIDFLQILLTLIVNS